MAKKLFGTDGVRGVANIELTAELAFKLGRSAALVLSKSSKQANILIANDSRISSQMLEAALVAGICSVGANAHIAGIVPTPALAYLVTLHKMDAGIMISASHNPFYDNGIKFFDSKGYKLSDAVELEIEELTAGDYENAISHEKIGRKFKLNNAINDYTRYIAYKAGLPDLSGKTIALDCANGATFEAAPRVFRQLGADVVALYTTPDGININDDCGSTKIDNLVKYVQNNPQIDFAFAYDGDGDRLYAVDERGNVLNGDFILSIIADYMHKNGVLNHNTLVGTSMTNLGLIKAGEEMGIKIVQTDVGDRYVLEKMLTEGYNLGGESSGHIIFLDYSTTGDGILASLILSSIIVRQSKKLSKINTIMKEFPQILENVTITNELKQEIMQNPEILAEIEQIEAKLGKSGRIVVRPSGTEPLIRIMLEGEDLNFIKELATGLADIIRRKKDGGA